MGSRSDACRHPTHSVVAGVKPPSGSNTAGHLLGLKLSNQWHAALSWLALTGLLGSSSSSAVPSRRPWLLLPRTQPRTHLEQQQLLAGPVDLVEEAVPVAEVLLQAELVLVHVVPHALLERVYVGRDDLLRPDLQGNTNQKLPQHRVSRGQQVQVARTHTHALCVAHSGTAWLSALRLGCLQYKRREGTW